VGQKLLIAVLVAAVMVVASWGVVFASMWQAGGMVTVAVDPGRDGPAFTIMVPMAAIEGALMAADVATDGETFMDLERELGDWGPLVAELMKVVEESPSATFVEVMDGETQVLVAKRHGRLVVDVEDYDVSVHVSMPVRPAVRSLRRLLT
jgi:hypothetical protein